VIQTRILLMGGLGNQLFQFAAARYVADGGHITFESKLGNPRKNLQGRPELMSLLSETEYSLGGELKTSKFVQKIINYAIRKSAAPGTSRKFIRTLEFLILLGLKIQNPSLKSVYISPGLGLDTGINSSISPTFLIGYFQSRLMLDDKEVLSRMMDLSVQEPSRDFLEYESQIREVKPLVIHVRLGDYLLEPSFGIPSVGYLESGLKYLVTKTKVEGIWLFSDDPQKATSLIPGEFQSKVFVVDNPGLSAAESLQLMRYGRGYLIANSTFSWWAAQLRFDRNAPVVAPRPWFKSGNHSLELIPSDWVQLDSDLR
jgi:hypothetical protein